MTLGRYFGYKLSQREDPHTTPFFVFVARSKEVKKWAGIRRTEEVEKGTQRLLKKTRSNAVSKFFNADSTNTIPNNILLAFQPGTTRFISADVQYIVRGDAQNLQISGLDFYNQCEEQVGWGFLEFDYEPEQEEHLRPALIVDGQHRLYGMTQFEEENLPVLVVSLIEPSPQEQAFQFIVINKKAVSVSTDNAKSIIADYNEQELEKRLTQVGIRYGKSVSTLQYFNDSPASPFFHLLEWAYNRERSLDEDDKTVRVPITTIEQSLRYIKKEFTLFENDDDSAVDFFCSIWNVVKITYSDLWGKNSKFMRKVNINALNEYIVYKLKVLWSFDLVDIFDVKSVEDKVLDILKKINQNFWLEEWTIKVQDNANVREMIKSDLESMADNDKLGRDWFEDLQLPDIE